MAGAIWCAPIARSVAVVLLSRLVRVLAIAVVIATVTFLMLRLLRPESFPFEERFVGIELLDYLQHAFLRLDLGNSRNPPFPEVTALIREGLPADLSLFVGAYVIGFVGGCLTGAACALAPRSLPTRVVEFLGSFLLVAPVYFVGSMLLLLFAPIGGILTGIEFVDTGQYKPLLEDGPLDWARGLLVPWLVTAAPLWAICLRLMYTSLRDVMDAEYIRTARGKGLTEWRVITRHGMPAAVAPVILLAGAYTPILVGNALLVEQVFNVPGVFRVTTGAIDQGDFEVLQGLIILGAMFVVVTNAIADLALLWLDPRTRG